MVNAKWVVFCELFLISLKFKVYLHLYGAEHINYNNSLHLTIKILTK